MKLIFFGGTGEATGSNYVLESGGMKIMVDCGLHQGSHYAERENFEPFPYDARSITAVFVTHSHLDHIGRLPSLVRAGFEGKIYSTGATKDFAELMLLDSEHLLAREAEREARPPLYTTEDIMHVRRLWDGVPYHRPVDVGPFHVELFDAGHILGSAIVKVQAEGKTIIFSGDLGNFPAPIIQPTEFMDAANADYCVVESTYGDRIHENVDQRKEQLERAIEATVKAGGTLMVPTFAMERTQELLYHLHQLFEEGRIPRVPVFIDSPLAIKLTAIYKKYESYFNKETQAIARTGDDILNFPGLRLTLTTEQSKEINGVQPPKVVIAGSGMSNGGRILHHEQRYLPDPKSTILFVGYQAAGSMGRQILDGAPEVRIFGEAIPVRCKVINIPGYSAHADQPHLLEWVGHMRHTLKKVFVVQGEPQSSDALARKIIDTLAVTAVVPTRNETVEL
ncbi:MAG TPA: MBL fold metallo-hydrolase [Candidatus Paceibacterota bacterium]|nr:MBL fold metallo-hydrolase [Candidatus Paceibacterota bacterium]